jgi:hypothetical protein
MDGTFSIGSMEAVPRCSNCGSDDLHMPEGITSQDDLADDSFITCANCGTITTYAAIVESCEAEITKNIKESLGSAGDSPLN